MRAVIYCRVSSERQVDNFSLPVQQQACRAYCERQGWDVDRVFVERGESAKTADRTEFQAMLAHCRLNKGAVQYVVVYNLSRFARRQFDHHAVRALLQSLGIVLRSVTEPIDEGASGQLMEGIMAALHEFDNAQRRERTLTGMRAAVQAGKWCWHPPAGYRIASGRLLPDPERGPIVAEVFHMLASGHSISEAHRAAIAKGLKVSRAAFFALVRRSAYAGCIEVPAWGLRVQGCHEALVPQEVWDRAQVALGAKGGRLHLLDNPDFPLRRFVSCGLCGKPYTAGWSRGRARRYGYYRCTGAKCSAPNVAKDKLEESFAALLRGMQPSPGYMAALRAVLVDALTRRNDAARAALMAARRGVETAEKRRDRLVEAFVYDQAIEREMYEEHLSRVKEELSLARMRLADAQLEEVDAEGELAFAEHLATNAARLWVEFSADQKRRFQRFAFPDGVRYARGAFLNPSMSPLFRGMVATEPPNERDGCPERTRFEPVALIADLARLRQDLYGRAA